MFDSTRRTFLKRSGIGLATVGASGLLLRGDAQPTQQLSRDQSDRVLIQMSSSKKDEPPASVELKKVAPFPYGPFYKAGAPFRGKLSLPGEPGMPFVLSGRVWAFDTKQPLSGVVLDFLACRHEREIFKWHDRLAQPRQVDFIRNWLLRT